MIWLSLLVGLWAVGVAIVTLVAAVGVGRLWRRARRRERPSSWPTIAVLRPCHGAEPGLEQNLLSSVSSGYPGGRRVLLLVHSPEDAAHPVALAAAERAARDWPEIPVEVLVTGEGGEGNPKMAQMAAGVAHLARQGLPDVLVQADSDVRLGDETLERVIVALGGDERVGAAFACPVEQPEAPWATLADRASSTVLGGTMQSFLALAGLATVSGTAPQVSGALLALRADLLERVGFDSLRAYLGEDFELTQRMRGERRAVAVVGEAARCVEGGRTWAQVVRRIARWLLLVRRQRPLLLLSYPLLLAAAPLAMVAGLATLSGGWWGMLGAVALLAARQILDVTLRRCAGLPCAPLGFFVGESLLLAGLIGSLGGDIVGWRGRRYRVARGGRLEPV